MTAKNYRIGNYIMFGELRHEVTYHDIRNLYKSENTLSESYKDIPLTPEWFIKLGFTKGNKCYKTAYSIEVLKTDFYLRPSYKGGFYWGFNISDNKLDCELNDVKPIKYVHELQNLYFALTGEDLRIL
jgi:hypothetical protein